MQALFVTITRKGESHLVVPVYLDPPPAIGQPFPGDDWDEYDIVCEVRVAERSTTETSEQWYGGALVHSAP